MNGGNPAYLSLSPAHLGAPESFCSETWLRVFAVGRQSGLIGNGDCFVMMVMMTMTMEMEMESHGGHKS